MPTIRQYEAAITNAEAAGDFAAASRMRQKVQEAKARLGITEPTGPSITEGAKARRAEARAKYDAYMASLTPVPKDTGIFEDFTTGFGRGFVGVGESAALGLAALAEEETETQLRDRIKAVADSFAPEGGDPESFTSQLGSAFGSIAGIAVPAAGLAALAPAAAATGVATGTAAALGVGAAAGEASERAREAGVSEEVRSAATLRGAPIGLLEVLPMARFVKSIDVPVLSKLVDKLGPRQVNTIGEKVRSAALTGGYEAGQEVAAEVLQNLNEQEYNAAVETFAGAGEAATFGGIAGGILDLFLGRRARRGLDDPDETGAEAVERARIEEDAPAGTQGELFGRGDLEGPRGDPLAQAERDRLFEEEPSTAVSPDQESFLPAVGPQLAGLPAPEVEERAGAVPKKATSTAMRRRRDDTSTIAGETLALTPEGQALTLEEAADRLNERAREQQITETPVSDEARTGRERAEIAQREQGDLFPTELAVAEQEAQRRAEAVDTPEPVRMTGTIMLDTLEVPAKAPIRKEIQEGAALDDPIVSAKTGEPIIDRETKQPITVRERLVRYGRNRGSKKLQDNIDRLLQGELDGVSTRQRDLPTASQRELDAGRDRTGVPSDLQGVGDRAAGEDTLATTAPVGATVGDAGRSVRGATERTGRSLSPVVEAETVDVIEDVTGVTTPVAVEAVETAPDQTAVLAQQAVTQYNNLRAARAAVETNPTPENQQTLETVEAEVASLQQQLLPIVERAAVEVEATTPTPRTDAEQAALRTAARERTATKEQAGVVDLEPETGEFSLADADIGTQAAELNARVEQLQSEQEPASAKSRSAVGARVTPPEELRARADEIMRDEGVSRREANDLAREELSDAPEVRTVKGNRDKYLMHVKDMSVDPKAAARMINTSPAAPMFGSANAVFPVDMPLRDSVIDKINAGDTRGALEELAKRTPDRRVARVARKLMSYVGTTRTSFVTIQPLQKDSTIEDANNIRSMLDKKDKYGQVPLGLYVPKENKILLNTADGMTDHVFLHEMTHAATLYEIRTNPNSKSVQDLNRIYEAAKEVLGETPYGTKNLEEFVAEAFTDRQFQRDLAKINPKGAPLSLWRRFKEIIARYLGFDNYGESAQAETNRLVDKILVAAPNTAGLDSVAMRSTQDDVRASQREMASVKSTLSEKEGRAKIKRDFFALFDTDLNPRMRKLIRSTLGVLPNSAVFDDIAAKIPYAKELGAAILEQRGLLTESERTVKEALDPIVGWASKASKNTMDTFNNLVYDSTIDEVDPSISLKEAESRYRKQFVEKQFVEGTEGTEQQQLKIDRYKELRRFYDSKELGAEGRRAYNELRDLYKSINVQLRDSLLGRIDGLDVDDSVKSSLKNDLFAKLLEAANVEPYFPLTRKGKYWLSIDNPADGETAIITYESLGDRNLARDQFRDEGYTVESIDPDNMKKYVTDKAPSGAFIGKILGTLNDKKIPDSTREQIARLYIESLPESSFTKSLLKRKKRIGYDMDAIEAARSKAYDLSRQAARIRGSNKIQNAVDKLNEVSKARKEVQNDRDKAVIEEMIDRANFAISPPTDTYAKNANRMAFLWTIGFNASSALVNLSQVPLFAYPMLAGKYGYKGAWDAVTGAQKLFVGSYVPHPKNSFSNDPETNKKFSEKYTVPSLDNYYTRTIDGNGNVSYSVRTDLNLDDKKAKELERIKPLIELAAKRGELNSSFLAETLSVDQSGRETTFADKVTNFSAIMFHNAEVMNRQTTMVAAYDLALGKITNGKPDSATSAQKQEAAEEALHQTQQINGGATLETGPRYAREGIGRVALMYKSYGIQMYYTMLKTAKQMVDAQFAGDTELRNQAFKQLAGVHLSALFFAGVQGLPLYGAVSMIYDMLQEDYEEDADEALRSYLDNDVLYKGLISEATGLDVSQRVKLTDLLFEADRFNSDPSPEESFMHIFGGPAWSVTSRAIEGLDEIRNGEIERGSEAMMPGAMRNLYKAVIRYPRDEGILTRRGDPIYDDITSGDMLTQFLGFPPVGYTREIEETSAAKGMESAARERRSKLLKRYYVATRFGDSDAAREALQEMDEFNRTNIVTRRDPSLRITSDTINRSMRRHMATTVKMHNGVLLSPYMKRAVEDVGFL